MFPKRQFSDAEIHRNRFLIAMTVTLAAMMELLDTSIVNVAISQIMGNLGATLEEVTWVSTGYIVANVIVLPISGWLSNRFGRRNYFMGSIALFIVSSFFCGNASTLSSLVFWRIVQGLGGGGLIATAQSTIFETFPPREIGTGMAIFGMGIMMGPTLGPTVGGFITYHASWPWIFYINIPIGIGALMLANNLLPDSRFHEKLSKVDWLGIAAAAFLYVHWSAEFKADLSLHVVEGTAGTQQGLFWMQNWLYGNGTNSAELPETLLRLLDAKLTAQASMIAFEQIFMLFSGTLACAIPLLVFMPLAKGLRRGGGDH